MTAPARTWTPWTTREFIPAIVLASRSHDPLETLAKIIEEATVDRSVHVVALSHARRTFLRIYKERYP